MGITGIKIATVLGDDVLTRLDALHRDRDQSFAHLDTGDPFSSLPSPPAFAAAYLGARPIVDALELGADIVITGRVADASLFLAPLVYEHGWSWDDWDRLAAGILVGHLLECSGQSLGGNYSGDWWALPHPWDLPYPMARVDADGTAVITKPKSSGRTGEHRHVAPSAALRSARPDALPLARRGGRFHVRALRGPARRRSAHHGGARHARDRHLQAVARVPRRLVRRSTRRVLVARRVREGEGHGRDPREAGRDGRAHGRRVAHRVLGCRRARRPDRAARRRRITAARAARVRVAGRVAMRRPTQRGHGRAAS